MKLRLCIAGLIALALTTVPIRGLSQSFRLAALVVSQTIDWNGNIGFIDSFDSANPN